MLVTNNADGSNGVGVSTANSGGALGDAWDAVTPGTNQTLAYDTSFAMSGASIKGTLAATLATNYVQWSTALGTLTTNQRLGGRMYFAFDTTPAAGWQLWRVLSGAGSMLLGVRLDASQHISWALAAGTSPTVGTTVLVTNTLYRIEWDFTGIGTAAGTALMKLYDGDSTTELDSISDATAQNFGSTAPTQVRIGTSVTAGPATSSSYWMEDLAFNDTGLMGPARVAAPAVAYTPRRLPLGV